MTITEIQRKLNMNYYEASKFKEQAELLGLFSVRLSLPGDEEIEKAIKVLSKESTAPDKETPDWMESDIRRGIKWAIKRLTGNEA